ncbi:MAG: T9SS type A sorting domain-containing protein [Bacteroidia bacterium]
MKRISKNLFLSFVIFIFFISTTARGSHLVGGHISYEHLAGNNYNIKLHIFYDCWGAIGAGQGDSLPICLQSPTLNYHSTITVYYDSIFIFPYHPCIPPGTGGCQGGAMWEIRELVFSQVVALPAASDWKFSVNICCRNFVPTTVDGSSLSIISFYTFSTLDNLNVPSNSSPQFNSNLMPVFCLSVFTAHDFSCTDPDGDSLVYRLDSTYVKFSCDSDTAISHLVYFPPYSYLNFLDSSTPLTMNSSSGILSFTPSIIESSIYSVAVEEYRNGLKIGSMKRQEEILITPNVTGISFPDQSENNILIFPNPANNILIVRTETENATQLEAKIIDVTGRELISISEHPEKENRQKEINLSGLARGVYWLRIETGNGMMETRRFVKE